MSSGYLDPFGCDGPPFLAVWRQSAACKQKRLVSQKGAMKSGHDSSRLRKVEERELGLFDGQVLGATRLAVSIRSFPKLLLIASQTDVSSTPCWL